MSCYRRADTGAQLDLLVVPGAERREFEVELTAKPDISASVRAAMKSLGLTTLDVVHTGGSTPPLSPGIRAVEIHRLLEDVNPLQ